MSDLVAFWGGINTQATTTVVFIWICINSVVLLSVMKERTSNLKKYQEHHGQSKLAYWLARFCNDIIFYLPVAWMAVKMMEEFDPQMDYAK